jgi:hypothetical protein
MVRTRAFQALNRGSIPRRVTRPRRKILQLASPYSFAKVEMDTLTFNHEGGVMPRTKRTKTAKRTPSINTLRILKIIGNDIDVFGGDIWREYHTAHPRAVPESGFTTLLHRMIKQGLLISRHERLPVGKRCRTYYRASGPGIDLLRKYRRLVDE